MNPYGQLQPYSLSLPTSVSEKLNTRERDSLDIHHAMLQVTWQENCRMGGRWTWRYKTDRLWILDDDRKIKIKIDSDSDSDV